MKPRFAVIESDSVLKESSARSDAIELLVQGAHCANCIRKIETGLLKFDDVHHARLNLSTGKLTVRGHDLRPASIISRLESLGFKAAYYLPSDAVEEDKKNERLLLQCLAIAGFGVAFVVPLTDATVAVWLGVADMGPATRSLLNWVVAIVACPTALLASRPFFRSAIRGLLAGRANMDVPISFAILLSLGLSVYQSAINGAQTYFDAAVMLAFLLLIGRYLDLRLRRRASQAARQLVEMQAVLVRRIEKDGVVRSVVAADVAPSDRLVIAAGERLPVDGVVESGDVLIDSSLVTGESAPIAAAHGSELRAGSIVLDRPIILRVAAAVADSLIADIARLVEAGQQVRSRYVRLADRAASVYVPIVHAAAITVFAAWFFVLHAPFSVSVTNAIAVLIVTCPCALGLATPAVQIVATGTLFRRGIIVKSGDALERLAAVDVAVFDKTGTVTSDRLEVSNRGNVQDQDIRDAAFLARGSQHPLARAVARAAGPGAVAPDIREVEGSGLESHIDGKVWRLGRANWVGTIAERSTAPTLWFRRGSALPVRFEFDAPIRPAARSTVAALSARKIETRILSGDRDEAVAQVGQAIGISKWKANVGPKEKALALSSLKSEGHRVLMVGDGINDAAALSQAHVSISPASASDAAQSAADIVFSGASLGQVVTALDVARQARRRVLENFTVAALYNLIAVPLAACGLVTPLIAAIMMASSSLVVTLNALRVRVGSEVI
jgi:Cu2+-exporting ATPase